jgi:hypothetical protein
MQTASGPAEDPGSAEGDLEAREPKVGEREREADARD